MTTGLDPSRPGDRLDGGLTDAELRRYGRHLTLPEVGEEGQERLKAARVLLVGAGGLGSPAALYLAAAGVGTLGVADFDRVEESNLHRQVLYGEADLGRSKPEAAAERLADLNPHVRTVLHPDRLGVENLLEVLAGYDLAVDGSDNFTTRYLVNDACVLAGKPDVWGAISRFEGQLSVFWAERGPCYRCLFPEPPPPGTVLGCAEAGVLGVLPGIIGTLQASEAIKLILGAGEPLVGRLVLFDALGASFREVRIRKHPDCPICSPRPRLTRLEEVGGGEVCAPAREGMGEERAAAEGEITPAELARRLGAGEEILLLDVRTPAERRIARIEGARHIPLHELPHRQGELADLADLDRREIVVHCHHGPRSAQAVALLKAGGFGRVRNLAGGIDAWSQEVDASIPRY
jgi:adenylyltransferase/sulfurtransferase